MVGTPAAAVDGTPEDASRGPTLPCQHPARASPLPIGRSGGRDRDIPIRDIGHLVDVGRGALSLT